ncbi:MAG TPA: acyl-CoA desaturase [Solirubrobacteraceae bacterium]|nr:acyl-CoA desaturase [Solirubrobacteraceae bacterium]
MKRADRYANLVAVFGPLLALVGLIPVAVHHDLAHLSDLLVFSVMYLVCGMGITVGYHRLLTHRSFRTYKTLEYTFACLGSLAIQGGPLDWVADHRKHHAHTDVEGDPHSPHVGHGAGVLGALRGLWHAHVGWTWKVHGMATHSRYAGELVEDRGMRVIHYSFPVFILVSAAVPFGLGVAISGTVAGGLTGLLWGGLIRMLVQSHVTWSVNSVCHFFGRRRFDVDDRSTNVWWLALPSFGESWHHNHHAFPRSAFHGLRSWELDPSALMIRAMRRVRLAWDVVEIGAERQAARLAPGVS